MQATSADRSVRSAGKLESGRTGPLESCATRSCHCSPGNGMAIEDISHLVGHSSTLVT